MMKRKKDPAKGMIVTGWIGAVKTAGLVKEHKENLIARYPAYMLKNALEFEKISTENERKIAREFGCGIFDMSESGFLKTLWNMAEFYKSGLEIDMKKIPVRQETVEVCEFLDLDPYELPSEGSLILVSEDALTLEGKLKNAGVHAAIAGYLTDGKARILRYGERVRYLDKPR